MPRDVMFGARPSRLRPEHLRLPAQARDAVHRTGGDPLTDAPNDPTHPDSAAAKSVADGMVSDELDFLVAARLELDTALLDLRERADGVLSTQGRLRGLLRANAAVAADLSLPVVLHRVAESARELLAARYAAIGVIGRDGQLEQFVHSGMPADAVARIGHLPTGRGILGVLISDPTPLRLEELKAHQASIGFPAGHPSMGSFLGVPIRVGEAVFGNLYVTERRDGTCFTADDEQLAIALAVAAGGAIANARLFAESEQRRRWLTASGEFTTQVLSFDDAVQPLATLAEYAAIAAMADFATVTISLGDDEVIVAAGSGTLGDALVGVTAAAADSEAGLVIRTGKATLIPDYRQIHPTIAADADIGPVLVAPLTAGDITRGALALGRTADRPAFTETDLTMAVAFAGQAAIALELVEARDTQLRTELANDHDRIADDMHDHVIQELFALGMGLQALATVIDQPAHVIRIVGYVDIVDRAISTLRTAIFGLQTARQDPRGLQSQLIAIANEHTAQLGYTPHMRFAGPLDLQVTGALASDVLAVTREAVSNCARHAHATRLDIAVVLTATLLTLEITDNGTGIGIPTRSSGTANMRTRAERHHGTFNITTPEPGGTRLTWTVNAPA